jgi:DNA-binding NarL/FixJ family response regulator
MNKALITVVLVDDHKIIRNLYKKYLESSQHFSVIADFEDGVTAIEALKTLTPDILLVDINMSPVNGLYVTENVLKNNPAQKIIGLSVKNQPAYAYHMLELGAKGYLTKTSPIEEIIEGILEVYNGKTYICNEVTKKIELEDNS